MLIINCLFDYHNFSHHNNFFTQKNNDLQSSKSSDLTLSGREQLHTKFFKHLWIFESPNSIILFINETDKLEHLTSTYWFYKIQFANRRWHTNANLSSKFMEPSFWKFIIINCDYVLMKNFLLHFHLHRL